MLTEGPEARTGRAHWNELRHEKRDQPGRYVLKDALAGINDFCLRFCVSKPRFFFKSLFAKNLNAF